MPFKDVQRQNAIYQTGCEADNYLMHRNYMRERIDITHDMC